MSSSTPNGFTIETGDSPIRVLQLTDTHLAAERGGTLVGMDTDLALQAVVDLAAQENPEIDLLLVTGDLSDQGAPEAYQRLQEYMEQLTGASFWLPGNHDNAKEMSRVAAHPAQICGEITIGRWQVVMLDSQIPGRVGGELGAAELERLTAALQRGKENQLYSLICLHHPPVNIGCQWLDEQKLENADTFFEILDAYAGVRGVLWGHVHQELELLRRGVKLMASPSTCVQFAPASKRFKADNSQPGYRWLDLYVDGRLESGVSRVQDQVFPVDLHSTGYL